MPFAVMVPSPPFVVEVNDTAPAPAESNATLVGVNVPRAVGEAEKLAVPELGAVLLPRTTFTATSLVQPAQVVKFVPLAGLVK